MSLLSTLLTPINANANDKGYFADQASLEAAYPIGENGWYAIVGSTDTVWVWDSGTSTWKNSGNTASNQFNALTSGTNTSSAMVVGTGASLGASGSGTITATNAGNFSISGNQTFSSTGQRVLADLTNATRANRLNFQTSTVNGNTGVGAIPNGTATTSSFLTYGGSDPDNSAYAQFHSTDSSHVGINSSKTGTGVTQPIDFQIDGVSKARVTTGGEVQAIDATTPAFSTASGSTNTGYFEVKGKTSGALRMSTADATAQTITLSAAAQTVGTATLSIPDLAGVSDSIATLAKAQTFTAAKTFSNTGLLIQDTNASHTLAITPGSDLTANRTFTLTTGDANRTLTLSANVTLDQNVDTSASPSFTNLTLTGGTVNLSADTNFVTSGGVNGFSVDTDTLSVDGTNNRVGILTTAPIAPLSMGGSSAGRQVSIRDYSLSNDHQYEGLGRDTNQLIYQLSGSTVSNVWRRGDSSSASTELMVLSGAGAFKLSTYGAGFLQTDASGNVTATAFRSVVTSTVAVGSATSLTTDITKTITSISVPAGTWQIVGNIGFIAASGTIISSIVGGVSQTNNTFPTPPAGGFSRLDIQFAAGPRTQDLVVGSSVVTLGSTTTIYLVAAAGFTVSTASAYGSITATPVIAS